MSRRRQLTAAIDVRWTPEIAARVKGRLGERLAARRERRRRAALLVTLVVVGAGGLALGWVGRGLGPEPRDVAPTARAHRQAPAAPAPPVAPSIALPVESPKTVAAPPRRQPARASRGASVAGADVVGDLLVAADTARLAGRPRDAVVPLAEIASRHANDPRAAIAAFQLGRVFADDLHDAAQAARAFRRAYQLDPGGPLARDAQARAAEAAGGEGNR